MEQLGEWFVVLALFIVVALSVAVVLLIADYGDRHREEHGKVSPVEGKTQWKKAA